ncbi:helix-turn-helix domain-containing protein [Halovenus sp. HT40]|uniref:helix-turn-helix domain-containing protein n=1 Tax=Halovenus sp. HT40 TaxID=3126691 RepID=UPI00300EE5D4
MNQNESRTEGSASSPEMTKPNCTIKHRHDEQLDQLAEERYASRSEALRAAIEELSVSISGEGRNIYDEILALLEKMDDRIKTLEEDLKDVKSESAHPQLSPAMAQLPVGDGQFEAQDAEPASSQTPSDTALQNEVYDTLSKEGQMTVSEITERIESEPLPVRGALDSLIDRGFITEKDGEPLQYSIRPTGGEE